MKKLFIIVLSLLLTSCAVDKPIVATPVEVSMPVAVPCDPGNIAAPDLPAKHLPATASLLDKVKALIIGDSMKDDYISQLEAAIKGCK